MKHYTHQAKQQLRSDLNVEFGQEFGMTQPLDHESHQAFLSAKAGGMITRKLADSSRAMWENQSKSKK